LADFARIANRPTTDFSSGYTDKIFDGTNDVTSNYSGNIALSANGKLTVTPDGTNNLSLDKVYTLKRTYSFDRGTRHMLQQSMLKLHLLPLNLTELMLIGRGTFSKQKEVLLIPLGK
jgi:hypothetical protein